MAQQINRLTALGVMKIRKPGYHADGGGLWLQVSEGGGKSWIFTYSLRGRSREMGLGSLSRGVTLAEARDERDKCNRLLREYIDPIEERKRRRAAAILATAKTITFKDAAREYIAAHRAGLKSVKHAGQWVATIRDYAEPKLGKLAVADIDVGLIHQVLEPIWTTKPETASRVRGRIEAILDWATVKGYRAGDNPAQWRGRLDKLLPAPAKLRKVKHHAALPYSDLPAFLQKLRQQEGSAARALEFAILTAARSGEVLRAAPQEIDYGAKVWTVPGDRMKGGKEHRVPLCPRAMEIVGKGGAAYLFPGSHPEKPLSNIAFLMLLRRIGYGNVTAHGFRSTFKDWSRERTKYENHVVEAALAHASGDKIEQAYARSDVLEKRRQLMSAWAKFCETPPAKDAGKVVSLRKA